MTISNDMNLGIDIMVEGGGEQLNVDSTPAWMPAVPSPL